MIPIIDYEFGFPFFLISALLGGVFLVFILIMFSDTYEDKYPKATKIILTLLISLILLFVFIGIWTGSERNQYKICVTRSDKHEVKYYGDFLKRFPNTLHKNEIISLAFKRAKDLNTLKDYKDFLCINGVDTLYTKNILFSQDSLFMNSAKSIRNYVLTNIRDTLFYSLKIDGDSAAISDYHSYLDGSEPYTFTWEIDQIIQKFASEIGIKTVIDTSNNASFNTCMININLNLSMSKFNEYYTGYGYYKQDYKSINFSSVTMYVKKNDHILVRKMANSFILPEKPSWAGNKYPQQVIGGILNAQLFYWIQSMLGVYSFDINLTSKKLNENGVNTNTKGLKYQIINQGEGFIKPQLHDYAVVVNLKCSLPDGTVFHSTSDKSKGDTLLLHCLTKEGSKDPILMSFLKRDMNVSPFWIGYTILPGMGECLKLMRIGSKYIAYIPEEIVYADYSPYSNTLPRSEEREQPELFEGNGYYPFNITIPQTSGLIYEIELLQVLSHN